MRCYVTTGSSLKLAIASQEREENLESIQKAHLQRFPGLDLLRFYAAVCVVLWHQGARPFLFLNGWDAVTLFFVLSGFLITYLLLAERERTSSVDLFAFYVRRTLRIYPLYLLVVLVDAACLALSPLEIAPFLPAVAANIVALPQG